LREDLKGIEIVWLSQTGLSNLNSGEGESNLVDIKKFKYQGEEYPYVSGQAMRNYLRQAIRSDLSRSEFMCIPSSEGEGCGNIKKCIGCDLFGFMRTVKGKGAVTRLSPVKVSPAVGLLPFRDNSTLDFLTRTKQWGGETGERRGDIVNVELGANIYRCGLSIDVLRVGREEVVDQEKNSVTLEERVPETHRVERIVKLLKAVRFITGHSKQARLLTDFTPDLIVIALQNRYSHRLQKLLQLRDGGAIDLDRFAAILDDTSDYTLHLFVGMLPGTLANEEDLRKLLAERKIDVLTPKEAINAAIQAVRG